MLKIYVVAVLKKLKRLKYAIECRQDKRTTTKPIGLSGAKCKKNKILGKTSWLAMALLKCADKCIHLDGLKPHRGD